MKTIASLIMLFAFWLNGTAQAPQKMSYQAVIRDHLDQLVANQVVGIQITLLKGSPSGTLVYSENQTPSTNANGLLSIEIGGGPGFSTIDWSAGPFFLKTEIDPAGGTNYTITGNSQLLSVPYALYAKLAGSYNETDPVFAASPSQGIRDSDITNWDTSYGWGNHTVLYHPVSWVPAWSELTGKPSTLDGFGITDGVTTTGDQTIAGTKTFSNTILANNGINANNKSITNVANPTGAKDAASKAYADALLDKIKYMESFLGIKEPVSDIDGNNYNTVGIGTQIWMIENLKTTQYNDGTPIPLVTDNTSWSLLTTPGYCWYNNDQEEYGTIYGALYNWYTLNPASNGGKNACPTGWHVPTDADWSNLTTFLGGASVASGFLKETGTTHWKNPNTGATNATHFTALPGGYRHYNGSLFESIGYIGYWWSATESNAIDALRCFMNYNSNDVGSNGLDKNCGFSVRCIRN